jgi:GTP cyclohydrolase II
MQSETAKSPTEIADEDIALRVTAGETNLFEVIMRRNNQRLYRAVRAIVRDESEVEDVMQEAYVQAYAHLGDFQGRARLSTWLTKIAVHEALARVRRRRRYEPMGDDLEMAENADECTRRGRTPEETASDRELCALVERAVDALPESFRIVFMLRAVEEMSVAETADCLDIPEDTVKTRLFRARALLQRDLSSQAEAGLSRAFSFLVPRCNRIVAGVFRRIGDDVTITAEASVPTRHGPFRFLVFEHGSSPGEEHVALVLGLDPGSDASAERPLVRMHSQCLTGEVFGSLKCDCREQLERALELIAARGHGALVYLRQEGRGIGLANKIRAYALQEQGADTVDANRALGLPDDARSYDAAGAVLRRLGARSIELLTNNPAKVEALRSLGFDVTQAPILVSANSYSAPYLATKRERMMHLIPDSDE